MDRIDGHFECQDCPYNTKEDRVASFGPTSINVYVCENPKCGNYYGSSNMPLLEESMQKPMVEQVYDHEQKTGSRYRHSRAQCPDCRGERVSVTYVRAGALAKAAA